MRPPAEMRREVRAKERGVWMRLANRLYAGNGTNHGYSSGVCCSLFIFLFSYISVLFTALSLITLSSTLIPLSHCCVPHESCDWASPTSLHATPTSISLQTHLGFCPPPHTEHSLYPGFLFTAHPALHSSVPFVRLLCCLQSPRRCTHHPSQCTNSQCAVLVGS